MAFTPVTGLLITDNSLQEYLVDKTTGLPLVGGVVTFYRDSSRTTLKNVYYQIQVGTSYQYIALPNPLTLSSVGTVVDVNGNDVKIFYYPYLETDNTEPDPYYITVYNSAGQLQLTRSNFPFNEIVPETTQNPTFKNYIINGSFFRNAGQSVSTSINLTNVTNMVICPSQHAGHLQVAAGAYPAMSDMRFVKQATGASDTITFSNIPAGTYLEGATANPPNVDVTPYYQLNFACTAAGAETYKYIQIPLALKQKNLGGSQVTITFWAYCATGSNNNLAVNLFQYLGTGQSSAAATNIENIKLTTAEQKYELTFVMPVAQDISSGVITGDDGWYLQFGLPAGASSTCNIFLAKPEFYIGSSYPSNSFESYDEIEAIIAAPRTGDVRLSLNSFAPMGWVACQNGQVLLPSIGASASAATLASTDCWQLYNLLWNRIDRTFAPLSGGSTGTPYGDWAANLTIQLPNVLGKVLMGMPTGFTVTYDRTTTPAWGSVAGVFTASSNSLLYVGAPVYLSGTMPAGGNFVAGTIYYAIPAIDGSGTQFQLATSYANAIAGTAIAAGAAADNGSGLAINFALGGSFGESRHVQLLGELVTHSHNIHSNDVGLGNKVPAGDIGPTTPNLLTVGTDTAGSSHPFNIVQPSTYFNVFLKL